MDRMPEAILSVRDVKKKIGRKWIIKGVSFDLFAGEIFGFLGPNGSGKTTTIRMLVDLIRPTEGQILICGKNIAKHRNEALQHIGCIVENPEMYPYMTGWENLAHYARMIPNIGEERIQEVVDIVGLQNRIHDKVKTYSLGMRQRLGIAQALLAKPRLLILDEPTNGLDPQGIKELREFIRRLADEGLCLFISSHLLSEIQMMCDRVAIISHGEVIAVGSVEQLLHQSAEKLAITTDRPEEALELLRKSGYAAEEVPHELSSVSSATLTASTRIEVAVDIRHAPAINRLLVAAGFEVYAIERMTPTLEQLFLSMTGGEHID